MKRNDTNRKTENAPITRDADYINYIENGDSAAVLAVKYGVKSICFRDKWIEIIKHDGQQNQEVCVEGKNGKKKHKRTIWWFENITIRVYPRLTMRIDYSHCICEQEKNELTWKIATEDIAKNKKKHENGIEYRIKIKPIFLDEENKYIYDEDEVLLVK